LTKKILPQRVGSRVVSRRSQKKYGVKKVVHAYFRALLCKNTPTYRQTWIWWTVSSQHPALLERKSGRKYTRTYHFMFYKNATRVASRRTHTQKAWGGKAQSGTSELHTIQHLLLALRLNTHTHKGTVGKGTYDISCNKNTTKVASRRTPSKSVWGRGESAYRYNTTHKSYILKKHTHAYIVIVILGEVAFLSLLLK